MTIHTRSDVVFNNGSVEQFRAWALAIRQALEAVGLVRTADTGQIDLTTVAAPGVSSASAGYDIFRFNDALQGQRPVFIRVEYGAANNSSAYPGLYFTVGTRTNGAGTIDSATQWVRRHQGQTSSNTGSQLLFASGDGSGFTLLLPGTFGLLFSVERTRNHDGTPNGDGLVGAQRSLQATTYINSVMSYINNYGLDYTGDIAAVPGQGWSTSAAGGDISVYPRLVMLPKLEHSLQLMFTYRADVVNLTEYPGIVNGGAAHNYLAWTGVTSALAGMGDVFAVMMRYE